MSHTDGRHRQSSEVAIRTWDRNKAYHCLQSPPEVEGVVTVAEPCCCDTQLVDNSCLRCNSKMQLHQELGPCRKDTARHGVNALRSA